VSTTRKPSASHLGPSPGDPYFYGFRYVKRSTIDGKTATVIEPLTEYDVLHPREGDHITQGDPHCQDFVYLRDVFTARVPRLPGLAHPLVLGDCLIDLGLEDIEPVGPDVAVFTNVPRRKLWSSFSVMKEKAEWVLVGEVTSPSTRNNDLNVKPAMYFKAGVPLYFIVDQESVRGGVRQLRLLGYERGRRGYRAMRLNADGRLWLEPLQLWLGVEGGRVVCYDAEGREIEDYAGVEERADEAEERAGVAEERASDAEGRAAKAEADRNAAEERVRQLEAELRRLRGDDPEGGDHEGAIPPS
jgi:colicin import membrane protein